MAAYKQGLGNRIILLSITLQLLIVTVNGLRCYQCFSSNKWRDCKVLTSRNCRTPETMCGKVYTKQGTVESYYRDCYSREFCETKSACSAKMQKCSVNCCQDENCNSSSRNSIAPFTLVTLVLLFAFLHHLFM